MNFGNLDNLSFGMGLGRAKPGQYIPAKNANLEGFDDTGRSYLPILVLLGFILVLFRKGDK